MMKNQLHGNEAALHESTDLHEALDRLNSLIRSALDHDSMMRRLTREAANEVAADAAAIGMFMNGQYVFKYLHGLPEDLTERKIDSANVQGLLQASSARDVVTLTRDTMSGQPFFSGGVIHSLMTAPFVLAGRVLGAMSFFSFSAPAAFNRLHEDFARRLAAGVTLAIENDRLSKTLIECQWLSGLRLLQLEAVYDVSPAGLCFLDTHRRFVIVNQRIAQMTGMAAERHIGKTIGELFPEALDVFESVYRQALSTGSPVDNVEIRGPAGSRAAGQASLIAGFYPVKDPAGGILGVNVVLRRSTRPVKIDDKLERVA